MEPIYKITIGCIADDFTGASDIASSLKKNGLNTVLINGCPKSFIIFEKKYDAIVIALKSRTQETESAINDSLKAFDWLSHYNPQMLYFKYCSTFDSTPRGNIGPVLDSLLEHYNIPYTLLCPTFLDNKRSVKDGILYVNDIPLSQSHMKDHPLTPMWNSDLTELMLPQSRYGSFKISISDMKNRRILNEKIKELKRNNLHFYLVPDYYEPFHASLIMNCFSSLRLLSGGSGLAGEYAAYISHSLIEAGNSSSINPFRNTDKPRIMFAGSCSVATRKQVSYYLEHKGTGYMLCPEKIVSGIQSVSTIWNFVLEHSHEDVLIYSNGSLHDVVVANADHSKVIEDTIAALSLLAVSHGYTRILSAGGETSGAITKALNFQSFAIGAEVSPGVPVMAPLENLNISLVLKSGNFGNQDFFVTTLK